MSLYARLRPVLFRFDPERAHNLIFRLLAAAELVAARLPNPYPFSHPTLVQDVWGLHFRNPIGLAAGLDKNARAPHLWSRMGFGFAELGTITALSQPGNPRPRIFRLVEDAALINRLGFNNDGAHAVAARLAALWRHHPPGVPIGINIGKSKVTPLAEATTDYTCSLRELFAFASYIVLNVSSPNTPGLRDLQAEAELAKLLSSVCRDNERLAREHAISPRPILVKIAPDLANESLANVAAVARDAGAHGLIATNTTLRREGLRHPTLESGGLSGAPLRQRATEVIRILRRTGGEALPIIGVGGISTAQDAYEKIRAGATLVQVYTALIYTGPTLPRQLNRGLVKLLQRDGFNNVADAVGCDA